MKEMVRIADNLEQGTGLYTISEVALYARIAPITLSRWLYGNKMGQRVLRPELSTEKYLTFLDFVDALAVRNLRVTYNIPLQKIREAVNRATDQYKLEHPFARRHTTFLFDGEILIQPKDMDTPVQISGKAANQVVLKPVVEQYLKEICFDPEGLAQKYSAFFSDGIRILMDPKYRFGEPIIENCHYTPQVLWEAAKAEGSVEEAAAAYGVDVKVVEVAFKYVDYLQGRAAA